MAGNQAGEIFVKYGADLTEYEAAARRAGLIAEQTSKKIQDENKKASQSAKDDPASRARAAGRPVTPDGRAYGYDASGKFSAEQFTRDSAGVGVGAGNAAAQAQASRVATAAAAGGAGGAGGGGAAAGAAAGAAGGGAGALMGGAIGAVIGTAVAQALPQLIQLFVNLGRSVVDGYYSQRSPAQNIENLDAGLRFTYGRKEKAKAYRESEAELKSRAAQLEKEMNDNDQIARDARDTGITMFGALQTAYQESKNYAKSVRQARNLREAEELANKAQVIENKERSEQRRLDIRTQRDVLTTAGLYGKYSIDDVVYNLQMNSDDLNFLGSRIPRER